VYCVVVAVRDAGRGVVAIPTVGVDTNIVMFEIVKPGLTAQKLTDRLNEVSGVLDDHLWFLISQVSI